MKEHLKRTETERIGSERFEMRLTIGDEEPVVTEIPSEKAWGPFLRDQVKTNSGLPLAVVRMKGGAVAALVNSECQRVSIKQEEVKWDKQGGEWVMSRIIPRNIKEQENGKTFIAWSGYCPKGIGLNPLLEVTGLIEGKQFSATIRRVSDQY